jgi:hypothetical protein
MPWSHYLARGGVVECIGTGAGPAIADAFVGAERKSGWLNLAAVSGSALDRVQGPRLDRRPPLRTARTTLRFAIGAGLPGLFTIDDRSTVRRLRLPALDAPLADVIELCEDIARHDWLLTTLLAELSRVGPAATADRRMIGRLSTVLETLGHLWMPAARLSTPLAQVWSALEARPGMSRQWHALTNRIRDHLMLAMVRSLADRAQPGRGE